MNASAWTVTSETSTETGAKTWTRVHEVRVVTLRPKSMVIRGEDVGSMVRISAEALLSGQVRRGDTVEILSAEFPQDAPKLRYYQIMEARANHGMFHTLLKEVAP